MIPPKSTGGGGGGSIISQNGALVGNKVAITSTKIQPIKQQQQYMLR